jgi:hypothetical protein
MIAWARCSMMPIGAGQHPVVIDDRAYISLVYWCRGIKGVEEW